MNKVDLLTMVRTGTNPTHITFTPETWEASRKYLLRMRLTYETYDPAMATKIKAFVHAQDLEFDT